VADRDPGQGAELAALVERARRGDPAGHRGLYDRTRPLAFRVARSFAELDRDDVEDVIQESFVRAFQSLTRLEDPARFAPWLLTIVRNRALTRLARRRAGSEMADELEREVDAHVEPTTELPDSSREAEIEVVRRVIDELPEGPEKETVRLFYVEGELSAREIAARLGVGKSAVTMRLERFRAKVKRRIVAEVARLRGEESVDRGQDA
jgi:RNA polymerase sigma-70 factor (ECF subfamily)